MAPPTFQEFTIDQVVNIKTSSQFPIKGDGFTDDTVNINAIIQANVGKVIYFPASSYIVTNTIYIPPGSRIIGEAYGSIISANGSNFYNPNVPIPMVQLGKLGEVGIGQIVDMVFTVADVLHGCLLVSHFSTSDLGRILKY
jgi:glucan 1,3-beta-glucosidase